MVRRYAVHDLGHSEAAMTHAAAADDSRMRRARIRCLSPDWEYPRLFAAREIDPESLTRTKASNSETSRCHHTRP
jgi:hypothetical protein